MSNLNMEVQSLAKEVMSVEAQMKPRISLHRILNHPEIHIAIYDQCICSCFTGDRLDHWPIGYRWVWPSESKLSTCARCIDQLHMLKHIAYQLQEGVQRP